MTQVRERYTHMKLSSPGAFAYSRVKNIKPFISQLAMATERFTITKNVLASYSSPGMRVTVLMQGNVGKPCFPTLPSINSVTQ